MKDKVSNMVEAPVEQYPPSGWPSKWGKENLPSEGT